MHMQMRVIFALATPSNIGNENSEMRATPIELTRVQPWSLGMFVSNILDVAHNKDQRDYVAAT